MGDGGDSGDSGDANASASSTSDGSSGLGSIGGIGFGEGISGIGLGDIGSPSVSGVGLGDTGTSDSGATAPTSNPLATAVLGFLSGKGISTAFGQAAPIASGVIGLAQSAITGDPNAAFNGFFSTMANMATMGMFGTVNSALSALGVQGGIAGLGGTANDTSGSATADGGSFAGTVANPVLKNVPKPGQIDAKPLVANQAMAKKMGLPSYIKPENVVSLGKGQVAIYDTRPGGGSWNKVIATMNPKTGKLTPTSKSKGTGDFHAAAVAMQTNEHLHETISSLLPTQNSSIGEFVRSQMRRDTQPVRGYRGRTSIMME